MWQVCHLKLPYKNLSRKELFQDVFNDGDRPDIQKERCNKSQKLISTISKCWSQDIDKRPEFDAIEEILSDEIGFYNNEQ